MRTPFIGAFIMNGMNENDENALAQFERQAREFLAEMEKQRTQLESVVYEMMQRIAEVQSGQSCGNYTWKDMVAACSFIKTLPHDLIHAVKERVIKNKPFTLDPAERPLIDA
jgi:hypothetical protein